ncbi:MAG: hypothetical protein Q8830_00125 [Candidatus Phytoplasma australasiaticum]|nr:hypothetical protein [Candidatus Phytoplasma australasiaticum]
MLNIFYFRFLYKYIFNFTLCIELIYFLKIIHFLLFLYIFDDKL